MVSELPGDVAPTLPLSLGAETIESAFRSRQPEQLRSDAYKWSRKQLWQRLLADQEYRSLAACFEELGWTQQDAPSHVAALYKLLSKHAHNAFQLSLRRVDIAVSVPARQPGGGTATVVFVSWELGQPPILGLLSMHCVSPIAACFLRSLLILCCGMQTECWRCRARMLLLSPCCVWLFPCMQEGVVDKQQAQALACMCRHLGLDWRIVPPMAASSSSGDSDAED